MIKIYFEIVLEELKRIFKIKDVFEVLMIGSFTYFFFYPLPYLKEEVREVPIAAMDQDKTTMSRHLLRMVDASPKLEVVTHITNLDEGKEMLKQRKVYGILVIPFDFEQTVLQGHKEAVIFFGDASYVMIYDAAAGAIGSLVAQMNKEILVDKQIAMGVDPSIAKGNSSPYLPVQVDLFNPQTGYATYVIPPVYMLIIHQLVWISIMLACVSSRNSRFDYQIVTTSHLSVQTMSALSLFGKYSAYLFVGFILYWIFILFSSYWYELPRLGGILTVSFFGFWFLSSVIFLGLGMSALFKQTDSVFLLILPISMVLFFIAGLSWPQYLMPESIQWLSKLVPSTSTMNGIVRLNQMGASFDQVIPELINLAMLTVGYGLIAYYVVYRYTLQLSLMKESPKNTETF